MPDPEIDVTQLLLSWRAGEPGALDELAEVAEVLGVSRTTAKRKWRAARIWLYRELDRAE